MFTLRLPHQYRKLLLLKRSGFVIGEKATTALSSMWTYAKQWKRLPFGPVSVVYRAERTVRVSSNLRRRLGYWFERVFRRHGLHPAPMKHIASGPVAETGEANLPVKCKETALIVGVGPGFGYALARKLAQSGMRVALASRNAERLDTLVAELSAIPGCEARAYGCNATNEASVNELVSYVSKDFAVPDLVVYSVQSFSPGKTVDVELPAFEDCWRHNCLGGFLVAREAARTMAPLNRGTIVLVGSTSGVIGRADHLNLAVGRFGLRAIAQVMARELGPRGIHVLYLIIDADIREIENFKPDAPQARPEDIAEVVYTMHRQPATAWTSELDVRPSNETFWEHC
jgi:NAD(P)-dependent dehydrogenase (short-subunit alcohol dehydrogenase family)